ncbi:hypothetical protein FRB95_006638 [Tulasnella sp. JGI-2019a]|nr:hypothetical protein FRB95_006638 [Tulasnella sp. JGI-2019a]
MSTPAPLPFVRLYEPKDFDKLLRVCEVTVDPVVAQAPDLTLASAIWCAPYPILNPESSFVLDDGNGTAVGYLVGAPSTRAFIDKYQKEYIPRIDSVRFPLPSTEEGKRVKEELGGLSWMLDVIYDPTVMDTELIDEGFQAHFHIDLLPEYQSRGYGPKLLDAFSEIVRKDGGTGVHVAMAPGNDRAGVWYERNGFVRKYVKRGGRWMAKKL